MFRILVCIILIFSTQMGFAQEDSDSTSVIDKYGPRRQISTIVYMGLAGAVLGLSTLSFYGRPQDHLTNIPIGFGAGVILGTVYMTYQAATNPNEFYSKVDSDYEPDFSDPPLQENRASDLYIKTPPTALTYSWVF